jgi:hypothetical protein
MMSEIFTLSSEVGIMDRVRIYRSAENASTGISFADEVDRSDVLSIIAELR